MDFKILENDLHYEHGFIYTRYPRDTMVSRAYFFVINKSVRFFSYKREKKVMHSIGKSNNRDEVCNFDL